MTDLYLPDLAELGLTDLCTDVWLARTPDGGLRAVRVDDMDPDHRAAVLRWCRLNAPMLQRQQRRLAAVLWRIGEITDQAHAARLRVLDATPPEVWVEDTALLRRLVQLTGTPARPPRPRARRLLPTRLRHPLGGRR